MKPTKCPSFSWFKNAKKEGVRKSQKKKNVKTAVSVTFKPKILLSACAWTS